MRKIIKIISVLWQLPQIIIGRLYKSEDDELCFTFDGVDFFQTKKMDGISLGDRIFFNPDVPEGLWIIRHEFGHVIQSRILGWLYIPIILIPSFLWYCLINCIEKRFKIPEDKVITLYYKFYTEKWANKLVQKKY